MDTKERQQTIAKVQKLYNLAEGEKKLGNDAAADTAKGMADKLKVKYSITEIEIKGTNYTVKQTTSTSQNKNYASAQEAAEDIFRDIFGRQRQQSRSYQSYHSSYEYEWKDEVPPKTYRYRNAFSYPAQHREAVKGAITRMLMVSGADVESYETEIKEKNFFGNPKVVTTRFAVTGTEEELIRFKKVFLVWMANN